MPPCLDSKLPDGWKNLMILYWMCPCTPPSPIPKGTHGPLTGTLGIMIDTQLYEINVSIPPAPRTHPTKEETLQRLFGVPKSSGDF